MTTRRVTRRTPIIEEAVEVSTNTRALPHPNPRASRVGASRGRQIPPSQSVVQVEVESETSDGSSSESETGFSVPPNLGAQMSDLQKAMASLINFSVQNARVTQDQGVASQAPVRVVINGEGVPAFNPSDPDGLKVDEWQVSLDQIREMHRWVDSAAIHFATAKLLGPAKVW